MEQIKHTLESCKESASRYKTRVEWQKGDYKSFSSAKRNGWLNECCVNMIFRPKKHSLESCKESASKYKSRSEWQKGDLKSCSSAKKNGWYDECCANMILRPKKHSLESCKESASKYTSRNEWKKGDLIFYSSARYNGWLDECCVNMIFRPKKHSLESCKESASKYKTRSEWEKEDLKSFSSAKKNGWYDECCVNMIYLRRKKREHTLDSCKEIASNYKTRSEWIKKDASSYKTSLKKGWLDECCVNMISSMGRKRKHTLDSCKEIGSNYKTRNEWRKKDIGSYQTAYNKGWLDECCANMILRPKKHSLESCKESASKYTSRNEWKKKDGGSYQTAYKKGWLNECLIIFKKTEKNNLKVKDKIDTNLYKHPKNKGGIYHKQPLGLNVTKAKHIAIKDILEDDFFKKNYIQYDHIICMLKKCPLQYYTIDLEIY